MNNSAFIQRWQQALIEDGRISDARIKILIYFSWFRNHQTHDAWVSKQHISEKLRVQRATVNRAMQDAVDHGYLRPIGKVGRAVRYSLEIPESVTPGTHIQSDVSTASHGCEYDESEKWRTPSPLTVEEPQKEPPKNETNSPESQEVDLGAYLSIATRW